MIDIYRPDEDEEKVLLASLKHRASRGSSSGPNFTDFVDYLSESQHCKLDRLAREAAFLAMADSKVGSNQDNLNHIAGYERQAIVHFLVDGTGVGYGIEGTDDLVGCFDLVEAALQSTVDIAGYREAITDARQWFTEERLMSVV